MLTIISRIANYGFKNFWRNGWLSTATVAIMLLAVLAFGSLLIFRVMTTEAVVSIKEKIDIRVTFKPTASEDEILNIKQSLEGLTEVREVQYVPSSQALEKLKERYRENPVVSQSISQLDENPLRSSLNIKAKEPEQYAAIAEFLRNPNFGSFIEEADYQENRRIIDKLTSIVNVLGKGGLVLTVVFAFLAGLVVFNTVRLAIYSNRDEIGIMRAVGASNIFVRGPFMIEGFLAGTIAAVCGVILFVPLLYVSAPYAESLIPSLNIFRYYWTHLFLFLWYLLLFGVLIGVFSSYIAVRRYLRN